MSARFVRLLPLIAALLVFAAAPAVAGAASVHWNKAVRIEPAKDGGLDAVSCPSTALCLAVDAAGNLIVSTKPTGGNGSWAPPVRIDSTALTGIACPTIKLCVAVDAGGSELSSVNPTGGARAWSRPVRVDSTVAPGGGYAGLSAIACPSAALCVAVDGAPTGNVVTTTNPTGGAGAWHLTALSGILTSVSCPSTTLCVAAGTQHFYATNPAGGAWHATGPQTGGGVFSGIACPTVALCVGVGYGNTSTGLATTTTVPKGSVANWTTVSVESAPPIVGTGILDAVGCTSATFCVAVDASDNAWATSAPTGGVWTGGLAIRKTPVTDSSAISCTSSFCVVVDSAGVETTGIRRG